MLSNFRKVCEFNLCAGHAVNNSIQHDIFKTQPEVVKLRYDLIAEEVKELFEDGFDKNNFNEIIDALCDILYVVYGAGAVFGIDLDEEFREPYRTEFLPRTFCTPEMSNFELVCTLQRVLRNVPPSTDIWLHEKNFKTYIRYQLNKDLELLKSSLTGSKEFPYPSMDNARYFLVKLLNHTYYAGHMLGIDLDKTFALVHDSNMSKFCTTEQEAQETVESYKNDPRYKQPAYRLSQDDKHWVVYNAETGKILKSHKYSPVDFSGYLTQHHFHRDNASRTTWHNWGITGGLNHVV